MRAEYLSALYRPDLHTFQMEMTRTGIGAERRWSPVSSLTRTTSDLASTPLLTLLERSGVVADNANQTISATLAGPEIAELLAVEIGSPLIAMTRVVLDDEGRCVEYLSALYRPDLHTFQMEMTRTGIGAERRWSPVSSLNRTTPDLASGKRRKTASRRRP